MGFVSVVMPAYNEGERIIPMLHDLVKLHREKPGLLHEVIVVDDGSKDATAERVMQYEGRLPLQLIRMQKNGGKWSAVRAGLDVVSGRIICILDADASVLLSEHSWVFGSNDDEYGRLARELERNVVLVGSRFHVESDVEGKSFMRRLVSKGYRMIVRSAYRYGARKSAPDDMQCPFKVFSGRRWIARTRNLHTDRFAGDIELLFILDPVACADLPVHFVHMRGSKVKAGTAKEMLMETIKLARRERTYRNTVKYLNKLAKGVV